VYNATDVNLSTLILSGIRKGVLTPRNRRSHLDEKLLLTIEEAAQRLGIGRSHAYIYVMRGELPSVKLGRARRVPAIELEVFVERLRSEQEA